MKAPQAKTPQVILAVLISFVFIHCEAFALSGGPTYSGATQFLQGNYAGVILPDENTGGLGGIDPNSIGLFTMTVPQSGLSTGDVFFFGQGVSYTGTMKGFADPDNLTLTGVLDASHIDLVAILANGTRIFEVTNTIGGNIYADFVPENNNFSGSLNRLQGTSACTLKDLRSGAQEDITMIVDGIQQTTIGG